MVNSLAGFVLVVVMDLYPFLIHRQISEPGANPGSAVVVADTVLLDVQRLVGVAAKDALRIVMARVGERTGSDFRRHPQPVGIQPVNHSRDGLAFEIQLLQLQVKRRSPAAEANAIDLKTVELMAVDRDVAQAAVIPGVAVVNADADQMRHDVGQPVIVVSFHPDDFNVAFWMGKLADMTEKLPVLFLQACEVEVGEDIAEEDEALETILFQHAGGLAGAAGFGPQVEIRQDQRVVSGQIHGSVLAAECYGAMKRASILVQRVTGGVTAYGGRRTPARGNYGQVQA